MITERFRWHPGCIGPPEGGHYGGREGGHYGGREGGHYGGRLKTDATANLGLRP